MNTDKLIKAIQLLVKEEIKVVLPVLVKETVKREYAKLLKENKQLKEAIAVTKPTQSTFMDLNLSEQVREKKQFSKNPILNDILNETKPFNSRIDENYNSNTVDTGGWKTMEFGSDSVDTFSRANIAEKMGYGDFNSKPQGLGVDTGHESLNKAFNRDYSELMKVMDRKKGPWRPGM